jgi:hypothetical protein
MKEFKLGCSPITNVIYAGNVCKGMWQGKKHNVTEDAINSVAEYLLKTKQEIVFTIDNRKYLLSIKELKTEV